MNTTRRRKDESQEEHCSRCILNVPGGCNVFLKCGETCADRIAENWEDKHNSELWINIRRMENGRYVGNEPEDKQRLMLCGCPVYFDEHEFNDILKAVSFRGFGLRT
jgi:hypothetical protein